MKAVLQARTLLESDGAVAPALLDRDISDSWERCLMSGLDPHRRSETAILGVNKLYEARQKFEHCLSIARPEMEMLGDQITGHNYLVAFGAPDGTVLDTISDNEASQTELVQAIIPGSIWGEDLRGTNALGLVARLRKRVSVLGPEHYFDENIGISCIAAPIFDGAGNIAGILDVTAPSSNRELHTATLVNLAAVNVSNRLFVEAHRDDWIVLCHPRAEYLQTQSVGMLAFDTDGVLTGASAIARTILPGCSTTGQLRFSDIFMDGFGRVIDQIKLGSITRLKDRHGASVYVRLRPTRITAIGGFTKKPTTIAVPVLQARPYQAITQPDGMVFEDELLCHNIQISINAIQAGLPVRIAGPSGAGLSEIAHAIHSEFSAQSNCIVIDCALVEKNQLDIALRGQVCGGKNLVLGSLLEIDGDATVVLDGIEALGDKGDAIAKRLHHQLAQLPHVKEQNRRWSLVATERVKGNKGPDGAATPMQESAFWGHEFIVSPVAERTDFPKLIAHILSEVSPGTSVESRVVDGIKAIGETLTFYSLRRLLFQLAQGRRKAQINESDLQNVLAWLSPQSGACSSCKGNRAREAKCRHVRETLRDCSGNVSLAARRLGVSRTTIYKHLEAT